MNADTTIALILIALGIVGAVGYYADLTHPLPSRNAAPAPVVDPPVPARAQEFCSVAMCDEDVLIHLHAADETWPFCLGHGMPYLIEERAA